MFNEHQSRLWRRMLKFIEDFREGKMQYFNLVYELEGALDAGEFKDKELIEKWYDFWMPFEILYATKGNSVTLEDVRQDLLDMESFLKSIPLAPPSDEEDYML